jgi:arylsulfatase A-like enzyme
MQTGRIPNRSGLTTVAFQGQGGGLPAAEWTLTSVLKTAEYKTFFSGKWHLVRPTTLCPTAHACDEMKYAERRKPRPATQGSRHTRISRSMANTSTRPSRVSWGAHSLTAMSSRQRSTTSRGAFAWLGAPHPELASSQHRSSRSVEALEDHRSSASSDGPNSRKGRASFASAPPRAWRQFATAVKCLAMYERVLHA